MIPLALYDFEQESLRPQFHFTAPNGWLNDPNGLVYLNGNYHLFYQHNPAGTSWGNMTWGHAVSRDLVHWKHLPPAIEPDSLGTIFSGSAVVDKSNTSGIGKQGQKPIICFYTSAGGTNDASKGQPFTQSLAYSFDGQTFIKHRNNPLIKNISGENRDPKVFWHGPSKKWVMALYLADDKYVVLGSANLIDWQELSRLTLVGTSECPDLFPLPLNGNKQNQLWIFWGANGNYQVGWFDGTTFKPNSPVRRSHYGNTGYAAQTYSNAPGGRCVQISWLRESNFPNCPWNQQLGFPRVLSLKATPIGPLVAFQPVPEIKLLRAQRVKAQGSVFPVPSGLIDFQGSWTPPLVGSLTVTVNGVPIVVTIDHKSGNILALGQEAPIEVLEGKLNLRILVDRASIEVYAQDGLTLMELYTLPIPGVFNGVKLTHSGNWTGSETVYELRSALGQ